MYPLFLKESLCFSFDQKYTNYDKKNLLFVILDFFAVAFFCNSDGKPYILQLFQLGKWGPGPKVFPLFEKKCSCKLNIIALEIQETFGCFLLEKKQHS